MYSISKALTRAALINRRGIATRWEGRQLTWAETLEQVRLIAAVLQQAGLQDNDRVALLSGNSDTCFQCLFAVPWAGGIVVPVNARLAAPEVAYCMQDAGSRILLVDEDFLEMVPDLRDSIDPATRIICLGHEDAAQQIDSLSSLTRQVEAIEDSGRGGDDIFALYYTGGTTGRSKGVILRHEDFLINVLQWAVALGLTQKDVLLILAPMFHLVGGLNAIAATVLAAGTCIARRFDVAEVVETMAQNSVSKAALVPIMVDGIVNFLIDSGGELPGLKRISYGGAPMTESSLRRALQALPHTQFYQVYGQTEGGPNISLLGPEYHVLSGKHADKLRSAGHPIPGVELVILDPDDAPLPSGEVGEICVRGLTISPGYWNLPEVTAEAHRGGWLHTGDAGYLDEDGFLFIVDRIKDMIITGGENVYSAEVENVVGSHPAVAECAVIGIPSERWGESIHAIVRLREGSTTTEAELVELCRKHLAGFKCVRSVEFREEPFPLSGANKVLKRELRAPYWKQKEKQV